MIRSIVAAALVAGVVSWLVSADVSTRAASPAVGPDRTASICATATGTSTFDLWCGSTPAPEQRPV